MSNNYDDELKLIDGFELIGNEMNKSRRGAMHKKKNNGSQF